MYNRSLNVQYLARYSAPVFAEKPIPMKAAFADLEQRVCAIEARLYNCNNFNKE